MMLRARRCQNASQRHTGWCSAEWRIAFSGVGGFALGLQAASRNAAGRERSQYLAVRRRHWPDVERVNDVTESWKH
jgi:hypothetical protein